jgi:raffinose/stachyose/melibiose transport system substrate-binding protein
VPSVSIGLRGCTRVRAVTQRRMQFLAGAIAAAAVASLGVGASEARSAASSNEIAITMLIASNTQPGYDVLIANFERVYPNIKVNVTYAVSAPAAGQLEAIELAAGNAPDLLSTTPGCGTPMAVCTFAKPGLLAPMVDKPWAKRSLPLMTSLDKYGQGLFAFTPTISPYGIFTNDDLFRKLGLKVPQTFSQLLAVCQKAKAAGTAAIILPGAGTVDVKRLLMGLAVVTVYGKDKHWAGELKSGKTSFDGTPGWHQALQQFIDMNNAGCFQPGAAGTTAASASVLFAQGQGLILAGLTTTKGTIDAATPQFTYSHHPLPVGTDPNQTMTLVGPNTSLSVNARSSAQNQAAAQTFVDFVARPKQNALYAQLQGGLTQYQFLKLQIPAFMSDDSSLIQERRYVIDPTSGWWNASVTNVLLQDGIGLITGQLSIDDVLNAMDAAWKQGPS